MLGGWGGLGGGGLGWSSRLLSGGGALRRDQLVLAVGVGGYLVAVFVDFSVAFGAQQHEVGHVGGPVVVPPDDVVGVAGAGPHAAADALLVARTQGELLGCGGGPLFPPQVQRLAVRGENSRDHAGAAGDVSQLVQGDGGAVDQPGVLEPAPLKCVELSNLCRRRLFEHLNHIIYTAI